MKLEEQFGDIRESRTELTDSSSSESRSETFFEELYSFPSSRSRRKQKQLESLAAEQEKHLSEDERFVSEQLDRLDYTPFSASQEEIIRTVVSDYLYNTVLKENHTRHNRGNIDSDKVKNAKRFFKKIFVPFLKNIGGLDDVLFKESAETALVLGDYSSLDTNNHCTNYEYFRILPKVPRAHIRKLNRIVNLIHKNYIIPLDHLEVSPYYDTFWKHFEDFLIECGAQSGKKNSYSKIRGYLYDVHKLLKSNRGRYSYFYNSAFPSGELEDDLGGSYPVFKMKTSKDENILQYKRIFPFWNFVSLDSISGPQWIGFLRMQSFIEYFLLRTGLKKTDNPDRCDMFLSDSRLLLPAREELDDKLAMRTDFSNIPCIQNYLLWLGKNPGKIELVADQRSRLGDPNYKLISEHKDTIIIFDEILQILQKQFRLSEDTVREIKKIKTMRTVEDKSSNLDYKIASYAFGMNKWSLYDYVTYLDDCLSAGNKYHREGATFILNSHSRFLNIALTHKGPIGSHRTIARAPIILGKLDRRKIFYVGGLSGHPLLSAIENWNISIYQEILNLVRGSNIDHIYSNLSPNGKVINRRVTHNYGLFIDLNPRNRTSWSHQFAEYVARENGLVRGVDYTYEREEHGHGLAKPQIFRLINPTWQKIFFKRDPDLKGNFFLESVMQEPRNKPFGEEPDLVYDRGYVCGLYIPAEVFKEGLRQERMLLQSMRLKHQRDLREDLNNFDMR